MNLNKSTLTKTVALLVAVSLFLCVSLFLYCIDFAKISPCDPSSYAARIYGEGPLSDWHSLFMLCEGRGCIRIINAIFQLFGRGGIKCGVDILLVWWVLSTFSIAASLGIWGCLLIRISKAHVLSVMAYVLMAALLYFCDELYFSLQGFIDYYEIAWLMLCLSLVFLISTCSGIRKSWFSRCVWGGLLLVCLLHVELTRKNAIVIAPFLAYWGYSSLLPFCGRLRMMLLSVSVILCGGMLMAFVSMFIDYSEEHSQIVMMCSDVKIARLLRGEPELGALGVVDLTSNCSTPDYMCPDHFVRFINGNLVANKESWAHARNDYLNEWKSQPMSMLAARVIQVTQFFQKGRNSETLKHWLGKVYPACRNEVLWKRDPYMEENQVDGWERPVVYTISLVLGGCLYMLRRRKGVFPFDLKMAAMLIFSAHVYLASFMFFVPSADSRYHTFPMQCCMFAFSICIGYVFSMRNSQDPNSIKAAAPHSD